MAKLKGKAKVEFKKRLARGVLKSKKTSPDQKTRARAILAGKKGQKSLTRKSSSKKGNPKKKSSSGGKKRMAKSRTRKIAEKVAGGFLDLSRPTTKVTGMNVVSNLAGGFVYGGYEQLTGRLYNQGTAALIKSVGANTTDGFLHANVRNGLQTLAAALMTMIPTRQTQWLGLNGLSVEGRQIYNDVWAMVKARRMRVN